MGAYGSGSGLPRIIGSGDLWSCATATTPIVIEDIHFIRNAAAGGVGVRASQLSGASANFTMRRSIIEGFTSSFNGDRSKAVTLDRVRFVGPSNSFAINATATSGNNCDDWAILGCEFDVGCATLLNTSTITSTTGAWNRLRILGNRFNSSTANDINLGMPTSQANSAKWLRVTAPSTVEMFDDEAATIPASLPAWEPGATVFFAGFSNRANFGLFTVSSVTTNTIVVTETSLATEAIGRNKGIHLRDVNRAFNDVLIGEVWVCAGQSNMQGHAQVRTFEHIGMDPATRPLLERMRHPDGTPRVCERVWISSIGCGSMLWPPRMMRSFLRPTMLRLPRSSSLPRSPLMNQPPALNELSVAC
jgi:hypothetical protein